MIALTNYAQKSIDAAKAKLAPTAEELYHNMKFVENKFIAQLEAVSYTHLDVYKRQGEYGETNHAFVSNDFYTVFAGGFVGNKAPGAAAHQSAVKLETCA